MYISWAVATFTICFSVVISIGIHTIESTTGSSWPHDFVTLTNKKMLGLKLVTVHGSVCSFLCLCVWVCSLCLSALPSYRAPEEAVRVVTGVARLHCIFLAGVSVVSCQIVVTHVLSCSLSVLLVPESVFAWLLFLFPGGCGLVRVISLPELETLHCRIICTSTVAGFWSWLIKTIYVTRNWILSFYFMTKLTCKQSYANTGVVTYIYYPHPQQRSVQIHLSLFCTVYTGFWICCYLMQKHSYIFKYGSSVQYFFGSLYGPYELYLASAFVIW